MTGGTITGSYALGGLLGRAFGRQGSTGSLDTDVNSTIEDCIAFNPTITSTRSGKVNAATTYSGGAIIGCSSRPNTLKNCWRSPDMVLDYYATASLNVLFDHDDTTSESPLTQPYTYKWFSPYHGKVAAAGKTASDVAKDIGWDETVWDLTGTVPELVL